MPRITVPPHLERILSLNPQKKKASEEAMQDLANPRVLEKAKEAIVKWLLSIGIDIQKDDLEFDGILSEDGSICEVMLDIDDLYKKRKADKKIVPQELKGRKIIVNIIGDKANINKSYDKAIERLELLFKAANQLLIENNKSTDFDPTSKLSLEQQQQILLQIKRKYLEEIKKIKDFDAKGMQKTSDILQKVVADFSYVLARGEKKEIRRIHNQLMHQEHKLYRKEAKDVRVNLYRNIKGTGTYHLEILKPLGAVDKSATETTPIDFERTLSEVTSFVLSEETIRAEHASTRSSFIPYTSTVLLEAKFQQRAAIEQIKKQIQEHIVNKLIKKYNENEDLSLKEIEEALQYHVIHNILTYPSRKYSLISGPNKRSEAYQASVRIDILKQIAKSGVDLPISMLPEELQSKVKELYKDKGQDKKLRLQVKNIHFYNPLNKKKISSSDKKHIANKNKESLEEMLSIFVDKYNFNTGENIQLIENFKRNPDVLNWHALRAKIVSRINELKSENPENNHKDILNLVSVVKFLDYQSNSQDFSHQHDIFLQAYWARNAARAIGYDTHASCKDGGTKTNTYYCALSAGDSILSQYTPEQLASLVNKEKTESDLYKEFKEEFSKRHEHAMQHSGTSGAVKKSSKKDKAYTYVKVDEPNKIYRKTLKPSKELISWCKDMLEGKTKKAKRVSAKKPEYKVEVKSEKKEEQADLKLNKKVLEKAKAAILAWLKSAGIDIAEEDLDLEKLLKLEKDKYVAVVDIDALCDKSKQEGKVVSEGLRGRRIVFNVINSEAVAKKRYSDVENRLELLFEASKNLISEDKLEILNEIKNKFKLQLIGIENFDEEGIKKAVKILRKAVSEFGYILSEQDEIGFKKAVGNIIKEEARVASRRQRDVIINLYKASKSKSGVYNLDIFRPRNNISSMLRDGTGTIQPNSWEVISHTVSEEKLGKPHVSTRSSSLPPIQIKDKQKRKEKALKLLINKIQLEIVDEVIKLHNAGKKIDQDVLNDLLVYNTAHHLLLSPILGVKIRSLDKWSLGDTNEHHQIQETIAALKEVAASGVDFPMDKLPAEIQEKIKAVNPNPLKIKVSQLHINNPANRLALVPISKRIIGGKTQKINQEALDKILDIMEEKHILCYDKDMLQEFKKNPNLENWKLLRAKIQEVIANLESRKDVLRLVSFVKFMDYQLGNDISTKPSRPELFLRAYWTRNILELIGYKVHANCKSGEDRTGAYYCALSAGDSILDEYSKEQIAKLTATEDYALFKKEFKPRLSSTIKKSGNSKVCDFCAPGARGMQLDAKAMGCHVDKEEFALAKIAKRIHNKIKKPNKKFRLWYAQRVEEMKGAEKTEEALVTIKDTPTLSSSEKVARETILAPASPRVDKAQRLHRAKGDKVEGHMHTSNVDEFFKFLTTSEVYKDKSYTLQANGKKSVSIRKKESAYSDIVVRKENENKISFTSKDNDETIKMLADMLIKAKTSKKDAIVIRKGNPDKIIKLAQILAKKGHRVKIDSKKMLKMSETQKQKLRSIYDKSHSDVVTFRASRSVDKRTQYRGATRIKGKL